jgi:serine/threonine protein kinase
VKLADFGLSKKRTGDTTNLPLAGTQSYMAPEVWNFIPGAGAGSGYTTAVDLWALGCIVYRLACGRVPFPPGVSLMKFCDNQLPSVLFNIPLSGAGFEFLKRLLRPHPESRMNVTEALSHHWITGETIPVESSKSVYTIAKSPEVSAQDSTATIVTTEVRTSDAAGSLYTTESTLDYNTFTHAGLQSRRPSLSLVPSIGDQNSAANRLELREASEIRANSSLDIINFSLRFPLLYPESLETERPSESLLFAGGRENLLTTARESGESSLTMKGVLPNGKTQPSKSSGYQPLNNSTTSPLNMRRKETACAASLLMDSPLPSNMGNLSTVTPKTPVVESYLPLEQQTLAAPWEQKTPSYDPITSSTPSPKEKDPRQARLNATLASEEERKDMFNAFFPSQDEENQAGLNAFSELYEENEAMRNTITAAAATGTCIVS